MLRGMDRRQTRGRSRSTVNFRAKAVNGACVSREREVAKQTLVGQRAVYGLGRCLSAQVHEEELVFSWRPTCPQVGRVRIADLGQAGLQWNGKTPF